MEVNDYVRTRWGCIAKFEGVHEGFYEFDNIIMDESSAVREKLFVDIVEKTSPNILDLIEPWDLLYIDIEYGFAGGLVVPRIYETQAELDEAIEKIKNDEERELVGIVTHEQLESRMYEVKK